MKVFGIVVEVRIKNPRKDRHSGIENPIPLGIRSDAFEDVDTFKRGVIALLASTEYTVNKIITGENPKVIALPYYHPE